VTTFSDIFLRFFGRGSLQTTTTRAATGTTRARRLKGAKEKLLRRERRDRFRIDARNASRRDDDDDFRDFERVGVRSSIGARADVASPRRATWEKGAPTKDG